MVGVMHALREEHVNLAVLLDLLEKEVDSSSVPDYKLLRGILDYFLTYPDQYHHPKEDLVYQAMCRHDPAQVPSIGDLEAEHEELAIATRELSEALESVLERGESWARQPWFMEMAHAFVDSYRRHMAKEETDFFPEALRELTPQEWADIETRITDPTDPVFETRSAARLSGLQNKIREFQGMV